MLGEVERLAVAVVMVWIGVLLRGQNLLLLHARIIIK